MGTNVNIWERIEQSVTRPMRASGSAFSASADLVARDQCGPRRFAVGVTNAHAMFCQMAQTGSEVFTDNRK